jgi:hypothetical protein
MTTSHPGEESSLKVATTIGGLAQLGERLAGSQKVIGSSPLSSISIEPDSLHVPVIVPPLIPSDYREFAVTCLVFRHLEAFSFIRV